MKRILLAIVAISAFNLEINATNALTNGPVQEAAQQAAAVPAQPKLSKKELVYLYKELDALLAAEDRTEPLNQPEIDALVAKIIADRVFPEHIHWFVDRVTENGQAAGEQLRPLGEQLFQAGQSAITWFRSRLASNQPLVAQPQTINEPRAGSRRQRSESPVQSNNHKQQ